MKFVKGMIIGGAATVGAIMMYSEMRDKNRKRLFKKGKQFAKKMGII